MAFILVVAEESFKKRVFQRVVVRQRNLINVIRVDKLLAGRLRWAIFSRSHLFQGLIILICYKVSYSEIKKDHLGLRRKFLLSFIFSLSRVALACFRRAELI